MFLEELDQMQFQPQREAAIKDAEQASKLRRQKLKASKKAQQQKDPSKASKSGMRLVSSQDKVKQSSKKQAKAKAAQKVSKINSVVSTKKPKRLTRRRRKSTPMKVSARTLDD